MQVLIDQVKCQGYGNCVVAAPDVFDLDDMGLVVLIDSGAGIDDHAAAVRRGVRDCPVAALKVVE